MMLYTKGAFWYIFRMATPSFSLYRSEKGATTYSGIYLGYNTLITIGQ